MTDYLITGSNGVLGTKLVEALLSRGASFVATDRADCRNSYLGDFVYRSFDITDAEQGQDLMHQYQPAAIIHAAAFTDVDGAEREPELCRAINVEGAKVVAECAKQAGARLAYISTDYVFDGTDGPYREEDPIHPLGVYAQTKWEGEVACREILADGLICRTMALYGFAPHIARFNFVGWLISSLCQGQPVRVMSDQFANHTEASDLANAVLALIDQRAQGIFHTAGQDRLTRYDFARAVAAYFNFDPSLITGIKAAEMGLAADRPLNGGLILSKLNALGIHTMDTTQQMEVIAQTFPFDKFPDPARGLSD